MDDRTAYQILKIKEGTSLTDISKRHDHFALLYKHYLMGERLKISPEQLEQMKKAYESLIYKRIGDDELPYLYPQESSSRCYQTYDKIICPLVKRHKAKIIYTIVMCILTCIIIGIMHYRPVDFEVSVISQPSGSIYEFEVRKISTEAIQTELLEIIPGIKNPKIDYQIFYPVNGTESGLTGLYMSKGVDVYIMEETLLNALKEIEVRYQGAEEQFSEVHINKGTELYKKICDPEIKNQTWVAVISPLSKRKEQAAIFLSSVENPDEPN